MQTRIRHRGHEIRAEVEHDGSVEIHVDGVSAGRGVWSELKICERSSVLSFRAGPAPEMSRDEQQKRAALRRDESDELYARLETSLAAQAMDEDA